MKLRVQSTLSRAGLGGLAALLLALTQQPVRGQAMMEMPFTHPDVDVSEPAREATLADLVAGFERPPATARPWVFWYWMHGDVSAEGITADLEAMRAAGIGGACLMFIKAPDAQNPVAEPALQLSPLWWDRVAHALREARRCGIRLSMSSSDGFATAGGPWITPDLSMQRLTWTRTQVSAGQKDFRLPAPKANEGFCQDLRVYAWSSLGAEVLPEPCKVLRSGTGPVPEPSFFTGTAQKGGEPFRSEEPVSLTLEYREPVTLRSVRIPNGGGNYQANRLVLEVSDDGIAFKPLARLSMPRHGWRDWDVGTTHTVPATTTRFLRISWTPEGSEPGGEDLDTAKWKPVLKLPPVIFSGEPSVHQHEGKSGSAWRLAAASKEAGLAQEDCVPVGSLVDITKHLRPDGTLAWAPEAGNWTILRLGVTSTGARNDTGGAAKGLECDKLNPQAVRLQWEKWFEPLLAKAAEVGARGAIDTFHVDSWECGAQNWSPVVAAEFEKRRGYSLFNYLPVLAGVPVGSPEQCERFLHDYRRTLDELVRDNFYGTLAELAHSRGLAFAGECIAPVMPSDGLAIYGKLDLPMGEFWLRSPTHDKPNDLADAVSGAHIYGRRLVQGEAFTGIRAGWDEHPALLKPVGDLHFANGINRLMLHVWVHNPRLDQKPGRIMGRNGTFFQRDQIWWPAAGAWTDYLARCQAVLQQGMPSADIAVFTGEEIPSRAVLPGRLIATLPGLLGADRVERENTRRANVGQPRRTLPAEVTASAHLGAPEDWIDPLHGYAYDSVNPEVLLGATVRNGRIQLRAGASYALLVLPRQDPLKPGTPAASLALLRKLRSLVEAGAFILLNERPHSPLGVEEGRSQSDIRREFDSLVSVLWDGHDKKAPGLTWKKLGAGYVHYGSWVQKDLRSFGIPPAFSATATLDIRASQQAPSGLSIRLPALRDRIAWCRRELADATVTWVSNQSGEACSFLCGVRGEGEAIESWDPVRGTRELVADLRSGLMQVDGLLGVPLTLEAGESRFVVLRRKATGIPALAPCPVNIKGTPVPLEKPWSVSLHSPLGEPPRSLVLESLRNLAESEDAYLRGFSGEAVYETRFDWNSSLPEKVDLSLGDVANLAWVELNGVRCGTVWCAPYTLDVSSALKAGENTLRIHVFNTWVNRLVADHSLAPGVALTRTSAPWLLQGVQPAPSGLLGPVRLVPLSSRAR